MPLFSSGPSMYSLSIGSLLEVGYGLGSVIAEHHGGGGGGGGIAMSPSGMIVKSISTD